MKMVGIILAGGKTPGTLTKDQASASLPVGGYYNAVDFPLSSMVNSGMNKVAVVTQYSSRSLNAHLKSGSWWGFGRKRGGLFVLNPTVTAEKQDWYQGTIDALYDTVEFLKESHEPYVVISSGDGVYKIDFEDVLETHIASGAEITIVCAKLPEGEDPARLGVIHRDADDRIIDFLEKEGDENARHVSCGIYLMRRRKLIEVLEKAVAEGKTNFVGDIIIPGLAEGKTYAYKHRGYWRNISNDEAYYRCNMDFLKDEVRKEFLQDEPPVLTRVLDRSPAKYSDGAEVKGSLIGSGAEIEGTVINSLLFAGVKVAKGAVVENSVVLPNTIIEEGKVIKNMITDESENILNM